MKNLAETVTPKLNPDSVNVKANVLTSFEINDLDLSKDVLTYKTDDKKTFTKAVELSGT